MEGISLPAALALVVIGVAGGLWMFAALINWRGYGDDHASRSIKVSAAHSRFVLPWRDPPSEEDEDMRRFMRTGQKIVAGIMFIAMIIVAVVGAVAIIANLSTG